MSIRIHRQTYRYIDISNDMNKAIFNIIYILYIHLRFQGCMLSQVQWPSLSSFPAVSALSSWTFVVPWVGGSTMLMAQRVPHKSWLVRGVITKIADLWLVNFKTVISFGILDTPKRLFNMIKTRNLGYPISGNGKLHIWWWIRIITSYKVDVEIGI